MAKYRRYRNYRGKKKNKVSRVLFALLAVCLCLYLLLAVGEELGGKEIPVFKQLGSWLSSAQTESNPVSDSEGDCQVHYIDVGQGDSVLIRSDGSNILIDAGENDQGKTVVDYLKAQGVKKLDMVLMTHPHSDHIGGMDTVIREFEVGKIVMPRLSEELVPTTKTYTDVLMAVAEKGLKITPAKPGDAYPLGNGSLTILGPVSEYEDLNDTSLVCRFDYEGKRFLFTGDIEKAVEKDLLKTEAAGEALRADVLKLAHHGSKTSTSSAFYQAVDPAFCVISVGDGNSYGHPNAETLQTLKSNGAQVLRTDYQGSIVFQVSFGELSVSSSGK